MEKEKKVAISSESKENTTQRYQEYAKRGDRVDRQGEKVLIYMLEKAGSKNNACNANDVQMYAV